MANQRRLTAERRSFLNSRPRAAPDLIKEQHFYACESCGQHVDKRRLGDVVHHEQPGHQHLTGEPTAPKPLPKVRGESEPRYKKPALDREAIRSYYEQIAPVMLPFVAGRPLNLFRCSGSTCFFQRNLNHPATEPGTFGAGVRLIPIEQKNGRTEDYLYVEDAPGLLECVEAKAVEFHGWGSRIDDVGKPDRVVIDLDPGEGVTFELVKDATLAVRNALADVYALWSFALLSGGKGIRVVVPLTPAADWATVRGVAREFCESLAVAAPDRFTIALRKAERGGRVFLDYLRNQRSATAVLPYSVRARKGLPVAAPVGWRELRRLNSASAYTVAEAAQLYERAGGALLRAWVRAEQTLRGLA